MRRLVSLAIGAVLVAAWASLAAAQTGDKPRVLYLTHTAGFKHDVLRHSEKVLQEIGREHGFDVTATKDVGLLTADRLKDFDAVVFYTTGELPISEEQKADLMRYVRNGGGFVGIHSATDTFYKWPEYGEMIGGYFDEHPWHEEVTVKVEDPKHPAVQHLGDKFVITDEIYQFRNFSREDGTHVLLSVDNSSVDLSHPKVKRADRDFALAWTRQHGKGRVFYTALGHRPEVWNDQRFQRHLAAGIQWAMNGR